MAARSLCARTAGVCRGTRSELRVRSCTAKPPRLGAKFHLSYRPCRVQCKSEIAESEHALDYYGILGVTANVGKHDLKHAYRDAVKLLHPDLCDSVHSKEERHEILITLNRAYRVLNDGRLRAMYDTGKRLFEEHSRFRDYTGQPLSKTAQPAALNALFVDETLCIGCQACVHEAPNTFILESEKGRARVAMQWADSHEALHTAMDICPINCIYLVPSEDLALLEYVHASQPRTAIVHNSCESMSGRAKGVEESPFRAAERFKSKLAERLQETQKEHEIAARGSRVQNAMNKMMNNVVGWPWRRRSTEESMDTQDTEPKSAVVPSCPWSAPRHNEEPLQLPATSVLK